MTRHAIAFEAEQVVPPEAVRKTGSVAVFGIRNRRSRNNIHKKRQVSPATDSGGRRCGAGQRILVWLGLLDGRAFPGLHRRRLCEGRQHDGRARRSRAICMRSWSATTSASGPARCWRGSTTATSRSRSSRPDADVAAARRRDRKQAGPLDVQQAVIDAARATLDVDQATATFAEQENKRYTDLAATGYGSVQNAQLRNRATRAHSRPSSATRQTSPRRRNRSNCSRPKFRKLSRPPRARPGVAAAGRAQSLLHRRSSHRSTASSATAPCASANMCRPVRN